MQQIVIRHLSGQRASEVESFPANLPEDLIAGRDPLASIHFDSQADDLVSRQHLRITKDADNPGTFRLIDLQSRNGTYVNRRRVYGSTFLNHNDKVQLGASGPEFRFELDPPPYGYANGGPQAATAEMGIVPQTREILPSSSSTHELSMSGARSIGRATVERMLDDTFGLLKQESNKVFVVGLVCLVAVLLVGIGTWMYIRRSAEEQRIAQQQNHEQVEKTLQQTQKEISAASQQITNGVSHLTDQVSQSEQKTQASLHAMSQKMSAIKRAQDLEAKRHSQATNDQLGAAATGTTNAPLSFGENLDRVNALVKQNRYADALEVSRQMMRLDPNRYEGYFYGGVSALETQQMELARNYLKQAEAKAPAEKRSLIQPLLATAQQISAKEK